MTVLKTSMRNFFAHKGRMALSAIAVLLSVGFVCGTLVFTDTMTATFDKLFAATAADVTVSPKGAPSGADQQTTTKAVTLPASVVGELKKVNGVKSAIGKADSQSLTVVTAANKNLSPTSGAPTIGTNWDPTELRSVALTSGHAPRGPTELMVDSDTADKHHLKIGDELRVIAVPGDFKAKITGITTFKTTNPGAAVFYFDTATAQTKLLGSANVFSNIMLTADKGVSNDQLKKAVAADLGTGTGSSTGTRSSTGTGYKIQTKAESTADNKNGIDSFLGVIKTAMLGFAGIAVLVGIFLIVNTFSMLVAQRTREIGLMRALGASRGQVNRSVLVEALFLGIIGSLLGIGGGVGLAIGLMKFMSSTGMKLDTSELTIKATTPVIGLAIGVIVTVLAAYLPARRAGKVSPMAALRDAGTPADGRAGKIRAAIGILLTGIGAAALVGASQATKTSTGASLLGLGVVLSLLGFVVVGPLLAGVVVRVISAGLLRVFGPVGRLAERNALRNPRRTGATAAALMIGLALVAGLSVVGSSMVASASDQLDKSVGADFIIEPSGGQPVTPEIAKAVKSASYLAHVTENKFLDVKLTAPDGSTENTSITAANPTYAQDLQVKTIAGKLPDAYNPGAMSVGEGYATKNHIRLGDQLTVAFKGGTTAKLTINAITSKDTVFDQGAMYTNITTAARYVPADKMPMNYMMFAAAKSGQQDAAYQSLKQQLSRFPQITVRNQADYKQVLKDQIGQLLNLIYGLLALAIIVAILGVVNTLALSVVERTREIGLMRAIGMSRRQLRRMIRLESIVIALFGAVLGLGLGMGWGATAQKLLALQGLGVLEIPWSTIVTVFIGSAFVGLAAALFPAFRAGRLNVLNAIATE
ncbi:ABC transporter permease [Actinacidiphila oryziradicis]|uniref:ABC transporter permease n=1 Tax=Actinacidiphila oryziradicis TaxID=2571141 RepID=UPI0023F56ABC|nr:ABC transporter permease [Actinacidiphila oryziradicis]MCW2870275.1 transport system integral rane protein [Actinacidiphila oryziradicis]